MKKYYLIGEISKIFNIPKQTLRYYEQEGILKSHKNADNGYRLYGLEEIIALTDIITYRSIGIPIKDIKKMFNTMSLDNIIDVISNTEESIKEKITYYTQMEANIKKRKEMFMEAQYHLGRYSIVKKIDIRYFTLTEVVNGETMNNYLSDNYSYIMYIENVDLNVSNNMDEIQYGLGIENINELEDSNYDIIEIDNKENEYLMTVMKVKDYMIESDCIEAAKRWLKNKNKKVYGNLIGKYLASSYEDSPIEYYKIWIPICGIDKEA